MFSKYSKNPNVKHYIFYGAVISALSICFCGTLYAASYQAGTGSTAGWDSSAVGLYNTASGITSYAFGGYNLASGNYSGTFGYKNTANGYLSYAFGGDNLASGNYSGAFGYKNTASGPVSYAYGYNNKSSGSYTSVFGTFNTASGYETAVVGNENTVSGNTSVAFGDSNTALGDYATVIGSSNVTYATGFSITAVGKSNYASGANATAIGSGNTNTGNYSTAVGTLNEAKSNYATCVGYYNRTTGVESTLLGYMNYTSGIHTTAVGISNTIIGSHSKAFGDSNQIAGEYSTAIGNQNIVQTDPDAIGPFPNLGNYSFAAGNQNKANGLSVAAIGDNNTAGGKYTTAIGYKNTALVEDSLATGSQNTASKSKSAAIGYNNTATEEGATAVGNLNTASGYNSNTIGSSNIASGTRGSAFGYQNTASGPESNAFGYQNTASNMYDSAFGYQNTASGRFSSAFGFQNTASGMFSTALGARSKATGDNSVAIGTNAQAVGSNSISIGNGNIVNGANSGAIGDPNVIDAANSYAVGNNNAITSSATGSNVLGSNNTVTTANTQVLGDGINRKSDGTTVIGNTVANSVYLGNDSQATAGSAVGTRNTDSEGNIGATTTAGDKGTVASAVVGSLTLDNFAGATANGAVTVGAAGTERRIQNVAAGEISATSTDAINGSQLYSLAMAIDAKPDTDTYTTGATYDAANKKLDFTQNNPALNYSVDLSTLTNGLSSSDYQLVGKDGLYGDAGAYAVDNNNKVTLTVKDSISGSSNEVVISDVAKASDVAKGWTSQIDGQDVSNIKMGEKQNFLSGDNIQLTNDNGAIKVSTKQDVTFQTVNATSIKTGDTTINNNGLTVTGGPTITKTEVNVAGNKITNVQAGTDPLDAVNVSQMNQVSNSVDQLGNRVDKVGAGAAALAALHPLDFDPDDKWNFASGYGNYRGDDAFAIGAFYRPNEDTMFSLSGTLGNGDNMIAVGASFKFGQNNHVSNTRVAMAKEIKDLRKEMEALKTALLDVNAGQKLDTSKLQLFPDIPENHWAYEYISVLAGNGIVEGYPDGQFSGDRSMTRYEYAAMLYRSMLKGAKLSDRILTEFAPELERIRVDVIDTDKNGNPTIERVRVIPGRG